MTPEELDNLAHLRHARPDGAGVDRALLAAVPRRGGVDGAAAVVLVGDAPEGAGALRFLRRAHRRRDRPRGDGAIRSADAHVTDAGRPGAANASIRSALRSARRRPQAPVVDPPTVRAMRPQMAMIAQLTREA